MSSLAAFCDPMTMSDSSNSNSSVGTKSDNSYSYSSMSDISDNSSSDSSSDIF